MIQCHNPSTLIVTCTIQLCKAKCQLLFMILQTTIAFLQRILCTWVKMIVAFKEMNTSVKLIANISEITTSQESSLFTANLYNIRLCRIEKFPVNKYNISLCHVNLSPAYSLFTASLIPLWPVEYAMRRFVSHLVMKPSPWQNHPFY